MPVQPGFGLESTTTVQAILDGTAQDIRQALISTVDSSDANILIDYVNRVCLETLRTSSWRFLISDPQQFITQMGISKYWIGTAEGNGLDQYDTGLGISDLRRIKEDEVYDRTNFVKLFKVQSPPLSSVLAFRDGSSRSNRPKQWSYDPDQEPYVLNIYPAPDNQSTYQPVPEAPVIPRATKVSGALSNRFYYVKVTFVDSFGGESVASPETKVFVPENIVVIINPPQPPLTSSTSVEYIQWKVYASSTSGNETLQGGPYSTNLPWTEPDSGLTTNGAAPPTANTLEPIDGYLIQFRYWQTRTQLTDPNQVIQVPDDYKDIVIAGVNFYANTYLRRPVDAKFWEAKYQMGLMAIRRDQNMYPHRDYIRTDSASISTAFPSVEVGDSSITRTT